MRDFAQALACLPLMLYFNKAITGGIMSNFYRTKERIHTPEQALAYLIDCTLATVSSMAMKKKRAKYEYERQISLAQTGVDWLVSMKIDPSGTRAQDIIEKKQTVAQWAAEYEFVK